MALIVQREANLTTSDSLRGKPQLCHTCRERKTGVFTLDAEQKPMCNDCHVSLRGRPI